MHRIIFPVLCSIILIFSFASGQSSDEKLVIPAGTVIRLTLQDPLSSKLSEVGDEVDATLLKDLYVDDQRLLTKGTLFSGRVTLIQPARRPLKGGQMQVTFDRVMIDGKARKLYSILESASNFARDVKVEGDSEGTLKGGKNSGRVVDNVLRGATIGMAGATIAILASIENGDISSTGGVVGAAVLGSSMAAGFLLTKGQEISLNPGTMLRLKLERQMVVD
jgi:hypothetical protein